MKYLRFVLPGRHRACWRVLDQPSVSLRRQLWSRAVRRMATRCMQQRETPSTPREVSLIPHTPTSLFANIFTALDTCAFLALCLAQGPLAGHSGLKLSSLPCSWSTGPGSAFTRRSASRMSASPWPRPAC